MKNKIKTHLIKNAKIVNNQDPFSVLGMVCLILTLTGCGSSYIVAALIGVFTSKAIAWCIDTKYGQPSSIPIIDRIQGFTNIGPDWDGHGGTGIDKNVVDEAIWFVSRLQTYNPQNLAALYNVDEEIILIFKIDTAVFRVIIDGIADCASISILDTERGRSRIDLKFVDFDAFFSQQAWKNTK